ncbi:MAG: DUF3160 domain-containing protein [Verrucomicrobiae bacterium]|nr:DUF3160 domain-containing protein [Verrucomicrobiae bacterium]
MNFRRAGAGPGSGLAIAIGIFCLAGMGAAMAEREGGGEGELLERPRIRMERVVDGLEMAWPGEARTGGEGTVLPWYELQASTDLETWHPVGERVRAAERLSETMLRFSLRPEAPRTFYRTRVVDPRTPGRLGEGGAAVFGYEEAFQEELDGLGWLTPEAFAERYPSGAEYLPGITWDPTTAEFWDEFNADPAVVNQGLPWGTPGYRIGDYRMNAAEREVFGRLGFVVSGRLGNMGTVGASGPSFGGIFYQLWYNDLPVFISADALLHVWHRTFSMMLSEIEETMLFEMASRLLDGMAERLPAAWAEAGDGTLQESVLDADYLIGVARQLLRIGGSVLGQEGRVAETMTDIARGELKEIPDFMGSCRTVDFSQFRVRGHYTKTPRLRAYFQCMMWLGRIDLVVAGGPFARCPGGLQMANPRELGTAIVLHHLWKGSAAEEVWGDMHRAIEAFVGWTDSMTFPQLSGLLAGAGIESPGDVADRATLERLQRTIEAGQLGAQNIRSDVFHVPLGGEPAVLPRSFLVFGQKFVPDSWVFSKVVFDSILWSDGGEPYKVRRRVPSALDVAFAALGNNQVVPDLVARILNGDAIHSALHVEQFRDGRPYQHNLAAVRAVLDRQGREAREASMYTDWLDTLRALSEPTTDPMYPEAMRTRAWAMRTLNTQLASWTQLRHDTVLYAKQSYTSVPVCFYPAGYVEPRVAFWRHFRAMTHRAAETISRLRFPGSYMATFQEERPHPTGGWMQWVTVIREMALSEIQERQVAHLRQFTAVLDTLAGLAAKQLAQEPFTDDEVKFIRNLIQDVGHEPYGSGSTPKYSGWYPGLFYRPVHLPTVEETVGMASDVALFHELYGAVASDVIVTDVHTNPPSPMEGDPGSVLHQGIGEVQMLMVAVENGPDRMIYAGPVMSHYEFEVVGPPVRLTDTEWENYLRRFNWGPPLSETVEGAVPPSWTREYLRP